MHRVRRRGAGIAGVRGEIPCRALGAAVEAYDASGRPVLDEVGELVLTEPLPSMPVCLWNDPDGSRLRETYYADYPGVWRHGDWVRITPRATLVISGRSDSTLNRGGVRMGTAEFYSVVEDLPEVAVSLVVGTGELVLFVVPSGGSAAGSAGGSSPGRLDEALERRLREVIRKSLSPRHVPDRIVAVAEVPRTLNGKKCEVPVKRILSGVPVEKAVAVGALQNPKALEPFVAMGSR